MGAVAIRNRNAGANQADQGGHGCWKWWQVPWFPGGNGNSAARSCVGAKETHCSLSSLLLSGPNMQSRGINAASGCKHVVSLGRDLLGGLHHCVIALGC